MHECNKNRQAIYKLTYHLVIVTKYRHPCINENIKNRLEEIAHNLFTKWNCTIIEMNGEEDHIHILFDAPSQIHLANVVNSFKTVTSRYIRKEFPDELKPFTGNRIFGVEVTCYSQREAHQLKLYVRTKRIKRSKLQKANLH
ncbi:IS200/IS605 family transposase [Bacillus paramycoides]|uniref:IS200/IS605 family transposase n=1 Tax=Bacillus paramycoides TaxID=2026194 RepID=UPI003D03040A